jgi:predicted RND superfamily exporter protein
MYRLTRLTLDHPRIAWLLLMVVTGLLGAGVPQVRVEHGSRVLVGSGHPIIKRLDSVVNRFGGGLPIRIGWPCGEGWPCAHALDESSIRVAQDLTQWLELRPEVRNVVSPSNATILVPRDDGFDVRRLVEGDEMPDDLDDLIERATSDELWLGRIVSRGLSAASILVQTGDNDPAISEPLLDDLEQVLARHRRAGFEFMLEGMSIRAIVSGRDLNDSTARLIPLLVLLTGTVLLVLTRSISQAIIALGTMGVALLWTQGTMGWLGWPQDGIHQVLAPLILIVGICDAVHLLTKSQEHAGTVRDRLLEATRDVGPPCAVTTATTAVALASFTTSGMFSFVRFGAISAIGVAYCLVLTFTLLPLAATLVRGFSLGAQRDPAQPRRWMETIVGISRRNALRVLQVALVLLVAGGVSWATWLRVDTDWVQAFGEDSRISQWIQFFGREFGGTDTLEVELELPEGETFEGPAQLEVISALGRRLAGVHGLGDSTSVVLPISRLNAALNEGDSAFDRPSDSLAGNAELLELLSFDDPDSLIPWLTPDRRVARLSVDGRLLSHAENREQMNEIRAIVDEVVPRSWGVLLTGLLATDEAWTTEVQSTQLRSFPTAFLLVFVLASVFLKSLRLGLAAMIPTLVPVVVVLGSMGWLGLGLDIGRAMVAAVVIGIGVDDAIHFLYDYRRRVVAGAASFEAVRDTIRSTGRAIVTTSVSVAVGFLALLGSAWQTISSFGFFVALSVIAALFSTLFVLPALLLGLPGPSDDGG